MRINAVLSAALLAGSVYADDAQKVLSDESSSTTVESSTVAPNMPTFTVSSPHHCTSAAGHYPTPDSPEPPEMQQWQANDFFLANEAQG
jgi:hypothetical protein